MNSDSLHEYCKSMFELLGIPMIIYRRNDGKIEDGFFPDSSFPQAILNNPQITNRYLGSSLFTSDHRVSFYISDDQIAFGAVNDTDSDHSLYIGPCLLTEPGEAMMRSMLTRSNSPFRRDPEKYYNMIYDYIKKLPRFTLNRFLWLLSFSDNYLNHIVSDPEQFYQSSIEKNRIDIKENRIDHTKEEALFDLERYNAFIDELKVLILNGSLSKVMELWDSNSAAFLNMSHSLHGEIEPLRYAKNTFLLFVSDISESLYSHGISRKQAFSLISDLMKDAENCIVTQQIESVYRKALSTFTKLCETMNVTEKSDSELIRKALNYIHDHISEPIFAEDIADHIGISRGYLSSVFNHEMEMKISDYVNLSKVKVAESLLLNTDASIIDISHYLSFSSQSHFNNVFRKLTGTTPLSYRRSKGKTVSH